MIFYFSATGNSKYVAARLSEEFNEGMISIPEALNENKLEYIVGDGEKIFFVFPIYYYGLPGIVTEFIKKVNLIGKDIEVCAVSTCGGSPGGADKIFKNLFNEKDIEVKGFYKVKMVDNYVMLFKMPLIEEQIMVLRRSDGEINNIIDAIKFNYRVSYKSSPGSVAGSKVAQKLYEKIRKTLKFTVGNMCDGCGLCESICPEKAIQIKEGKPVWIKDKCAHCCGCINRCPEKAIEYGKRTVKKGRYVNPNVEL